MRIGTIVYISDEQSIANAECRYMFLKNSGFACLHLLWNDPRLYTPGHAAHFKALGEQYDLPIINFTPALSGPMMWDIEHGPATNGLYPATYRKERVENILRACEFCTWLGVDTLSTHVGYLPVNRFDPDYISLIHTLKHILAHMRRRGQRFLIETGQEAPIILRRLIDEVNEPNLLVNFDPGNIVMSGLGMPLPALDVLGDYIAGFHAKDGRIGLNVLEPEVETLIGQGDADFDCVLHKLVDTVGYKGDIIIEREVPADQRDRDLLIELEYLNRFFGTEC